MMMMMMMMIFCVVVRIYCDEREVQGVEVRRRMQWKATCDGMTSIDDYDDVTCCIVAWNEHDQ